MHRCLSVLSPWSGAAAALLFAELAATAAAQVPTLRADEEFVGRRAWVVENGTMRVTLIQPGGHIAEIRLLSDDPQVALNPMYVPAGRGYMGHLVCFPHFGPASPDERQQGLVGHGEAGSVTWQPTTPPRVEGDTLTFTYGADLPRTDYRIGRTVTIRSGESALHVEEWVENLAAYDRPYNWNQHATFGAPFVAPDRNVLDMSGGRALTDSRRTGLGQWAAGREIVWPTVARPDGTTLSLREFRAVPDGQVYTAVLVDDTRDAGWFTLSNADLPLLIGYVFPAADHRWIIDWQNQPRADSQVGTARGIEFGTSPFDEGLRASVERAQLFGAATYQWIGAGQRRSTSFTIFLAQVPRGFAGVEDVQTLADRIVVTERGTSREVVIPHARR